MHDNGSRASRCGAFLVHGDFWDEDPEREWITSGEIAPYANFFHSSYFCGNSASRPMPSGVKNK
jgi:hypothetical protein